MQIIIGERADSPVGCISNLKGGGKGMSVFYLGCWVGIEMLNDDNQN